MAFADRFFYHPTRRIYAPPELYHPACEPVRFPTRDDLWLEGLWLPALAEPIGTVLHLHGNAGNLTGHLEHIAWLPACGWNVLCFDYRGFGRSQGHITRPGTVIDAHAALDFLLRRPDVAPDAVVLFGQSLGAAIGTVLAAQRPEIRGVALDGAFHHYQAVAWWHLRRNPLLFLLGWWVPHLMSRHQNPINYIAAIAPRPVLLIHGTADRIVPVDMAQRLYDAAGHPKVLWLVEGADHYEPAQINPEEFRQRLLLFFAGCLAGNA